jgi:hypothetical protein
MSKPKSSEKPIDDRVFRYTWSADDIEISDPEEDDDEANNTDEWNEEDHPRAENGQFGEGGGGGKEKGPGDHSSALSKFNESREKYQKESQARLTAIAEKHGVDPNNIHQHPKAWREYKRQEKPHAEKQRALERELSRK